MVYVRHINHIVKTIGIANPFFSVSCQLKFSAIKLLLVLYASSFL